MIHLDFYRFEVDSEVYNQLHMTETSGICIYRCVLYQSQHISEATCPLHRAQRIAHHYLDNHYGYVKIYIDNQDDLDRPIYIKMCNHKKFKKDMLNNGIRIVKRILGR